MKNVKPLLTYLVAFAAFALVDRFQNLGPGGVPAGKLRRKLPSKSRTWPQPLPLNRRNSGRTDLDLYQGGFLTRGRWCFLWQGEFFLLPRDLSRGLILSH